MDDSVDDCGLSFMRSRGTSMDWDFIHADLIKARTWQHVWTQSSCAFFFLFFFLLCLPTIDVATYKLYVYQLHFELIQHLCDCDGDWMINDKCSRNDGFLWSGLLALQMPNYVIIFADCDDKRFFRECILLI